MVENRVKAFALFHQDRWSEEQIAEALGATLEDVERWLELEGAARKRLGTFPLTSLIPDRGHSPTDTKEKTCDEHGPYLSTKFSLNNPPKGMGEKATSFWTGCPNCNSILHAESIRRHDEIRNGTTSNRDAMRRDALRATGVPDRFLDCDIWNWQRGMDQQREVHDVVKSYCMSIEDVIQHGRCLVLFGASGTGKTHLACGIVRHVTEKGGTACYATLQDAIGRIRATYAKDSEVSEESVLKALCSVDMLVLDELGRQSDSVHEREMLFRILNRRYSDLRPTVLVSNLDRPKLIPFLGTALCDRLLEAGGRFLNFDWASQRSRRPPSTNEE